ncbi:MAG TPA: hypothetical protein ENJ50_03515 [Planctomycetaceae bacterium]|nr:hypothetical protein [Planctomycetaceae bacterium]
MKYKEAGIPRDVTWRELEAAGHKVGKIVAQAVDEELHRRHAEQFLTIGFDSTGGRCPGFGAERLAR